MNHVCDGPSGRRAANLDRHHAAAPRRAAADAYPKQRTSTRTPGMKVGGSVTVFGMEA
jgi:hypothetical protein